MNSKQYDEARKMLLVSHERMGIFLGRNKRTSIRYAAEDRGDIPDVVAMLLSLMLEYKLDLPSVRNVTTRWWGRHALKDDGTDDRGAAKPVRKGRAARTNRGREKEDRAADK